MTRRWWTTCTEQPSLKLVKQTFTRFTKQVRTRFTKQTRTRAAKRSCAEHKARLCEPHELNGMHLAGQFVQMYRMAQDSLQGQLAQMSLSSTEDSAAQVAFRALSTCSWEQTDSIVKVYVPLRGVQTELLRAVFEPTFVEVRTARQPELLEAWVLYQPHWQQPPCSSRRQARSERHISRWSVRPNAGFAVQVKVVNLKGKNYCFSINCTFRPINPSACLAVASKTKKNILITIKVRPQGYQCLDMAINCIMCQMHS